MEVLIVILAVLILALAFATVFIYRLIKKVEFYEEWILILKFRLTTAYNAMKAADIRGSFEADDEVGTVFKTMKANIDDLTLESMNLKYQKLFEGLLKEVS